MVRSYSMRSLRSCWTRSLRLRSLKRCICVRFRPRSDRFNARLRGTRMAWIGSGPNTRSHYHQRISFCWPGRSGLEIRLLTIWLAWIRKRWARMELASSGKLDRTSWEPNLVFTITVRTQTARSLKRRCASSTELYSMRRTCLDQRVHAEWKCYCLWSISTAPKLSGSPMM